MFLHGFVGAIGVSDDDAVAARDDIVEPLLISEGSRETCREPPMKIVFNGCSVFW